MKEENIRQHLNTIADALSNRDNLSLEIGIKYGKIGVAIFFFFYNRMFSHSEYQNYPFTLLNDIINQINNGYSERRINEQYADFGWFLEFAIRNRFLDINIRELNNALKHIDEMQKRHLEISKESGDYDILTGMLSSGYYFLSRKDNKPSVITNIKSIIRKLYDISYFDEKNANRFWRSKLFDDRIYFGISHGIISIILFLVKCYNAGIEKSMCILMIQQGISFILSYRQEITETKDALFPIYIGCEKSDNPLGWCYGDLSIAFGLYQAAGCLADAKKQIVLNEAVRIAKHYGRFKRSDIVVRDASIVDGVAGTGLLFNKFYRLTGDRAFHDAYVYWFKEVFKFSNPRNAMAGFSVANVLNDFNGKNSGLFSGISGIGLFLMEHLDSRMDSYHEFFYLS